MLNRPLADIFEPLLFSTLNCEGLGDYRTLSADTLSVWAQRAVQCCSADESSIKVIGSLLTNESAEQLFTFVCDFWTDSGAALGNALKELFIKLISLLAKVRSRENLISLLHKWTVRILQFPKNQRVLYFTLEILIKHVGGGFVRQQAPSFSSQIFLYMGTNALANPIGKTLNTYFSSLLIESFGNKKASQLTDSEVREWTKLWANDARLALINTKTREHVQTYFLPQIFKKVPQSLKVFVEPFMNVKSDTPEDEISLLVGCLKIGQESNILDLSKEDNNVITSDFLESLFHHKSPSLRINALSLAITSHQVSKPVAPYVFEIFKRSLDNFFVESDPGFRNQFYGFTRQLVFRIRGSSYAMAREAKKNRERGNDQVAEGLEKNIEINREFCSWLVNYLEESIRPGSPYQYIFTGILLITLLVQSGLDENVSSKYYEKQHIPFPFHVSIYNSNIVRLLIDNIANNYEDIRFGVVKILKMAPLPIPYASSYDDIEAISNNVLELISGMRGREGDAGARGAELVFQLYGAFPSNDKVGKDIEFFEKLLSNLEQHVQYAKDDLSVAVREHPIHGYYSALRFIIENISFKTFIKTDEDIKRWKGYVERLTAAIFGIWNTVEAILCHESPEGNMPEELETSFQPSLEAKYGPATQVILSYSWRAVKESTSLLNALLDKIPNNTEIFPNSLVIDSGEVILLQLAGVHHRGAFSSVYPTFISCCKRCNRTKGLEQQPGQWLHENLALIKTKAQYITRRSGGLPYLITAVLAAEKDEKRPLLNSTFNTLYEIAKSPALSSAEEKMDLPQVHAFNCIKALFIETELSSFSSYFVDRALELAIMSFSHPIWAIRNCAVMLFTALQNRLFGTAKVSSSRHIVRTIPAKLFFSKYKTLRQVLLNIQDEYLKNLESENSHVETVFPVLSLLARLEATDAYDGLNDFKPLISVCLKSKIWKIREMAARVYPPLLNEQDIFEFSTYLLNSFDKSNQNGLHGALLAILNIVNKAQERHTENKITGEVQDEAAIPVEFLNSLFSKFDDILVNNKCAETARAYFRILVTIFEYNLEAIKAGQLVDEFKTVFVPYCFADRPRNSSSLNAVERSLQSELAHAALIILFETELYADSGVQKLEFVNSLILHPDYEVQQMVIEFLDANLLKLSIEEASSISAACWKLFTIADWDQVKGPAATIFSKIQNISSSATTSGAETYWGTLYSSISEQATEEINESCLEALGNFTGQLYIKDSAANSENTAKWLKLVKEFSHENLAFPSRQAALNSLLSFIDTIKSVAATTVTQTYLDALLQLHFFLSDDDEDIRETASDYTSELLSLTFSSTSVYCERRLLAHIAELALNTTGLADYFAVQAFERFANYNTSSAQLKAALTEDDLLFSFEKQNLYRDELRYARQFFDILKNMESRVELPEYKSRLSAWIKDAEMTEDLAKKLGADKDEVLGLLKDSEVYLALYRVKLAEQL